MKQLKKLKPSDHIAGIATVIALIALGVSIKSCRDVEHGLALFTRDFEESRSLLWTGTPTDKLELQLLPTNPDIRLEYVCLYLPEQLGIALGNELGPRGILQPTKNSVSLTNLQEALRKLLKKDTVYTNRTATTLNTVPLLIPIVLESSYIAKGQVRSDASLYYLPYYYVSQFGPSNKFSVDEITFKRLRFAGRLPDKENPKELVERLWTIR